MIVRFLIGFLLWISAGSAVADGMHTWMTIDEWGNQAFVFVDRQGKLNIACNGGRISNFLQMSDLKNIKYVSNNAVLLADGSVWVMYMSENDDLDYSIKKELSHLPKDILEKDFKCVGDEIPKNIYLKRVIKGGVQKIVGTPAFVLALTHDGRVLGFGAQESWGFGVPVYKNITDGAGEWIWNHESNDTMTFEDDMLLGFMGSVFRNIFGEIYVKNFDGFGEEIIDIAASASIFGAITKSGQIYVWGQKDIYGITARSSEKNIYGANVYEIAHSLNKPKRLFFGKQYIYIVDDSGKNWMWGGLENKLYTLPWSTYEFQSFKAGEITSDKPIIAPISIEFDGRSKISSAVPPFELYSPIFYFEKNILKIGYMFSNAPFYGRWLNEFPDYVGTDITGYVDTNLPLRKFYNQYDGVNVDVSALEGRKILSLDPFPVGYFPQYFIPVPGVVIDEEDNLYQFSPETHTGKYDGDKLFLAGKTDKKEEFYLPYPKLVKVPMKAWPVKSVIQE